jgi:hypothetical protein
MGNNSTFLPKNHSPFPYRKKIKHRIFRPELGVLMRKIQSPQNPRTQILLKEKYDVTH